MALTQPIPMNAPNSADLEARAILAVRERGTQGRPLRRQATVRGTRTVTGETAGTKVAGSTTTNGGSV